METRAIHTFDISGTDQRKIRFPIIRELFQLTTGNAPNGKNGKLDFLAVQRRINSFKETISRLDDTRSSKKLNEDFLRLDEITYSEYRVSADKFYQKLQRLLVEFELCSDDEISKIKKPGDNDEYYSISYQIESLTISICITFSYMLNKQTIVETQFYNFIL